MFREDPSDLVGEGIDIEVRLGDVSDSSLICRRLGWTTAFLVASPGYVEERGQPRGLSEIAQHDCICYSRGGETRAWIFADGADQVRAAISPRMVFNNATAVYRATIAGGGLAILSHIWLPMTSHRGGSSTFCPVCRRHDCRSPQSMLRVEIFQCGSARFWIFLPTR